MKKRRLLFNKEAVEDCLSFCPPPHYRQDEPEFDKLVHDAYYGKPEALCTYLHTDKPLSDGMRQSLARLIKLFTRRDRRRRLPSPREQVTKYIEGGLLFYLDLLRKEAHASGHQTIPYGFLDKAIAVAKEKTTEYGWGDSHHLDWKQIKKNIQRQYSQKPAS